MMSVEFSEAEQPKRHQEYPKMQKRSDQDLKAPEDPLSPWRAAKPRRSLRDIAGEPESPKALAGNNESPPNSSHKESTRLESGLRGAGGLDLSHSQVDDEG